MKEIKIPVATMRPRRVKFRYDRDQRRLYVSGSDFQLDMGSIKNLIARGLIPNAIDAIIYNSNCSTSIILRGCRLVERIGGNRFTGGEVEVERIIGIAAEPFHLRIARRFRQTSTMNRTIEVYRIIRKGLDTVSGISGIEEVDIVVCAWVSALLMSDHTENQAKLANFETVIGHVREVRSGLDEIVERTQPEESARGYIRELKAGLDNTLITLSYLAANLRNGSAIRDGKIASIPPPQPKPEFPACPNCGFLFGAHAPHDCDPNTSNRLIPEELDAIFGVGGWLEIEAPEQEEEPLADEHLAISREHDPAPVPLPTPTPDVGPTQVQAAKPLGMREGSKKHRVYVETKKLLEQNGPMHVDDMLESVSALGVFAAVKDPRINFANLLSQLKAKGLVDTDNRGNWSLPNGKVAD